MTLTPAFLDELRARTLLSTLIGRSVKLQKSGREYKACCPFHQEKSPSFYVNDDKGFYHCFGCGAHGDAIRWLTETNGLPFIDAVKELAATAGLEVPAQDPRAAERADRASGLQGIVEQAQSWFVEQLDGLAGAEARAYLAQRGITDATRRAFGFGFAPDARGKLRSALSAAGDAQLIEAGLLVEAEGRDPYDRFRGRLTIPIRDPRGRTIAFGGRIIGAGEPKYLNSPETPLFDKGRTLFNLDRAAAASRKSGRLIVVEGYLDVVALAQAGIDEAVAPLGTALTEAQLERLWRLVDVPILCFDGDAAGQKAAVRAALRALPLVAPGRTLRIATLPVGQDPDDLVRSGGRSAFEAVVDLAEPLVERLWRHELAAVPLDTPEARAGLRRRVADHARTVADREVSEQYLADFRRRFDTLYAAPPRAPFQPYQPRSAGGRPAWGRPPPRPLSSEARAIGAGGVERLMAQAVLAGLLNHPSLAIDHAEAVLALPLADVELAQLRDAMLAALFESPRLEPSGLRTILMQAGLGVQMDEIGRTNGLAFSFLRGDADPERARRDLGAAVEALVARPELDAALASATERLMADPSEAGFAEQSRLRSARDAADRSLALLAAGEAMIGDGAT